MTELGEQIINSEDVFCGEGIDNRRTVIYKMELKKNDIAPIADDFAVFLQECNGVRSERGHLFGMDPVVPFEDIIRENVIMNLDERKSLVILGYNEFNYLAYNTEKKVYQFLDIYDLSVEDEYVDCQSAIEDLLGVL